MEGQLIYLASPFTTDDDQLLEYRYLKAARACGHIMAEKRLNIFSPIVMGWPIAKQVHLPTDWEYWEETCKVFVSRCQRFVVLTLNGWKESTGVQAEIEYALSIGLAIEYMDPHTYEISTNPPL